MSSFSRSKIMELRWNRLNWKKFEDLLKQGYSRVILPVGTIEAHGVTPLGTDNIIPETIAERIAPEIKAIIAPTVNYGITRSLLKYPGSLTITPSTFKAFITELLFSFAKCGMKEIVVINGHGGQNNELKQAAYEVHEKTSAKVAVVHWWDLCEEQTEKYYDTSGGHGAVDETAAVIACAPDTIYEDMYNPDMLYHVKPGTNVYPIPSSILIYKENTGALDFDRQKANDYFKAVCDTIKDFLLDTFRHWEH